MKITYDPEKRKITLQERGLDFLDAAMIFQGEVFEFEKRMIAVGYLEERMMIVGYVQRGNSRHIFSMRKANEREIKRFQERFEEK
jgi:uncharacterized DUF497 family protein